MVERALKRQGSNKNSGHRGMKTFSVKRELGQIQIGWSVE